MTFPNEARPMLFELQVGATDWANITPYVFSNRSQTDITWGVPGEYSQSSPTTLGFQINNADGLFSPRNPLSTALFGKIGRNTPVRCSIGEGAYGMVLGLPDATESNGRAESTDSAQLSPTGDLDLRLDMEILPDSTRLWTTGNFDLITKYIHVDADRSYSFYVTAGKLRLAWTPSGTVGTLRVAESSVALPGPTTGRRAVRATLDVNNGAGGVDVKFYTAPTMAGPWTQLGTTQTSAGTSSVFNGGATTRIGANRDTSTHTWGMAPHCTVYKAEIRSAIDGTVIASPDFTTQPLDPVPFGPSNFSDAQGNNWTYNGSADAARIWYGLVDIRAHVECSSFPNRWDTSGNDAWVPIEGAGILRRLGNGQDPAQTGLRDYILSQFDALTSYFPLSGAEETKYSLNLGRVATGTAKFYGENSPVFTYGKDMPGVWLGSGMELNTTGVENWMRGDVIAGDGNAAFDFVWSSDAMGVLTVRLIDYFGVTWDCQFQDVTDTATIKVTVVDENGNATGFGSTAPIPELQDRDLHIGRFALYTNGFNTDFEVYVDGTLRKSGTLVGVTWNGTYHYKLFYSRYFGQTVTNLAHLTLWSHPTDAAIPTAADVAEAAFGYAGERAAERMERITSTAEIPFTLVGSSADTALMGPQYSESKLSQLRDAEQADLGFLTEPRDRFGLMYRTRVSMVGQTPALTLSYADGHIVPPFEPTDDDLLTKNDVTATRREGDSYRAQRTTGKLSVLEPPDGVGRYHDQIELNVQTDAMLKGVAEWLVNLGTVDQARYPSVTVDLGILAGVGLDAAARAVGIGDLLVIEELSDLGVYEDVRLLVLGGRETISHGGFKHTITWNCAPYQGYEGSVYATSASVGTARYDTDGSELTTFHGSAATTLIVAKTGHTLWTTDPAAFPLDVMVGGERITITAISGTSSPQNFTVGARAVNGVTKDHEGGTDVQLADPAYYSL